MIIEAQTLQWFVPDDIGTAHIWQLLEPHASAQCVVGPNVCWALLHTCGTSSREKSAAWEVQQGLPLPTP